MDVPLKLVFHNMDASPAVEAQIRQRVQFLGRFFKGIVSCRVSVESSGHRHRKGRLYHLHITITVSGRQIVVQRDGPEQQSHEDIQVAVRDAFDAAGRQLEDYARTLRGQLKSHDAPSGGRVSRLFKEAGYGFIRTDTDEEVYMHRNAVMGAGFDSLAEGEEVRYVVHEGEGDKGPQASTVIPIGKHHQRP